MENALKTVLNKAFNAVFKAARSGDLEKVKSALGGVKAPPASAALVTHSETMISAALLLGMARAQASLAAADAEIPPIPFEEASAFLRSKIPLTKAEWNKLEPSLRFRAFTAAALAEHDYIDAVKNLIADAVDSGEGAAETWGKIKSVETLVNDGAFDLKPGYFETVCRTNTQTAYNAGKRMQFDRNPPDALQLLVVEDGRTSTICAPLDGLTLPYNHPFWKDHWPPFHFNCRTTVRAVYNAMGMALSKSEDVERVERTFKSASGFGGNPVDPESFAKITPAMWERARRYGIDGEIEAFAASLGIKKGTAEAPRAQPGRGARDAPSKYTERTVDYSRASVKEAFKQEFTFLQNRTKKTGNECMSVMTSERKVTGMWEGAPSGINPEENMQNLLDNSPNDSLSLLHTHTNGVGLSGEDLITMCRYLSAKDVRAECLDGTGYYASIGKGIRPSVDDLKKTIYRLNTQLLRLPRYKNMKTNDVRLSRFVRERNELLKIEYGWDLRENGNGNER
jgi:SPP1 gp7 family putative phage head morphogenesis protein